MLNRNMFSQELKEIAHKIGQFFLKKNNNDYEATRKEIELIRINHMELADGKLTIETSRPGVLIGRKGQNIEDLGLALGPDIKIHITETMCHPEDFIIPYPPPTEEEMENERVEQMLADEMEFHHSVGSEYDEWVHEGREEEDPGMNW